MNLFRELGQTFKRSVNALQSNNGVTTSTGDLSNPQFWLIDFFTGRKTLSGQRITPNVALTASAYFAALRSISEDIAKLPTKVYRASADFQSRDLLYDHAVWKLFNIAPNDEMTPMVFRETMQHWALAWGGGIAEIEWDKAQKNPVALWPIHPSRIAMIRNENNKIIYRVRGNYSADLLVQSQPYVDVDLPAKDVFHLHGLGPAGNTGYSVLRLAAENLGLALAAQSFGATFFGNGTNVNGILTHPMTLQPEAYQRIRESWQKRYQGPNNANTPAILEEGMTWQPISIPPEEAQFLETRQFAVEDIARWFRMPPHKLQQLLRATFANIESQNIEYADDCLAPWCVRWNQEVKRKLLVGTNDASVFMSHNLNELKRADSATRTKYYNQMFISGAISPNEIRALEDMNPIPDGDKYFVQVNLTTLENAGELPPSPEEGAGGSPPHQQEASGDGEGKENKALLRVAKNGAIKNGHST